MAYLKAVRRLTIAALTAWLAASSWPCASAYGSQSPPALPPAVTHDCKVLFSQGLTYDQVFVYWRSLGAPQDMDDDRDGWPCESVYGERN